MRSPMGTRAENALTKLVPSNRTREGLGIVLFLLVFLAAAYAFSPRPVPAFPAAGVEVDRLLLLDGVRVGRRVIAAGERGHIFVSDDGRTWRRARAPTQSTLTALHFHDAKHGWAVGHDAVILRTTDGGDSWDVKHFAPDEQKPLLDVWFESATRGYAMGAYGSFYETTDGGETWEPKEVLGDDMHINGLAKAADGKLFIAGEAGTLRRSRDAGRTWEPLTSPYKGSFFGILGLKDGGVLAFGLRGRIFRSADSGQTWQAVETGRQASLMGGTVFEEGSVALVGQNGTLLVSRDDGKTFALQESADGKAIAAVVRLNPRELLLLGESGISRADPLSQ
jgi:photosystem II stability/assembly factor-like uncharacterized protein